MRRRDPHDVVPSLYGMLASSPALGRIDFVTPEVAFRYGRPESPTSSVDGAPSRIPTPQAAHDTDLTKGTLGGDRARPALARVAPGRLQNTSCPGERLWLG